MTVSFEVLGAPGRDNALIVRLDSGQAITRMLFDCGEGCVSHLGFSEIQAIDFVFFSHLHMDHVGGFDSLFRCVFDRQTRPNLIFGPPQTGEILQHRFQGYLWNLYEPMHGTWRVCDVHPDRIECRRYELSEAFAVAHAEPSRPFTATLIETADFAVECLAMNHLTPSLAYIVREKPRLHVDVSKLEALGLSRGPWLRELKEAPATQESVDVDGTPQSLEALRKSLLVETTGDSIAYLTDFLMNEDALSRLVPALQGCKTVVCESQYRHADLDLALRNYHMTCRLAAEAARRAGVGELVLFHLSDRYTPDVWRAMLDEAQAVFPNTRFPAAWKLR